jgi:hypothetical protein
VRALLGPDGDEARLRAEEAIFSVDPELLERLDQGRQSFKAPVTGFIRATATAQRESISATVLRALTSGAYGRWRTRMPLTVKSALAQAAQQPTSRALGIALESLCGYGPVLIEIDEFGKNLEHFASDSADADLFILQELAERCSGDSGLPALLITLQHLAFDDYVRGASAVQRREWGKVQGRFEDVPFVESAEQSLRLVAGAFEPTVCDAPFRASQLAWAHDAAKACEKLGLMRLLPGGADTLASCYPLHPLTLLALPEMCARFGQHGRTLFSFLTSREPHSVANFLDVELIESRLPTVGLDRLYDFFITNAAGTGGRHGARLIEIDTMLRETTGLDADQERLMKVVGVLNALSQGGPLRASIPVLRYALSSASPITDKAILKLVGELQSRGVLTYRGFADEYRLWQGSDLDIGALVEQSREGLSQTSPAVLLTGQHRLPPAIAGKHSQRVGMLRYFETVLADAQTGPICGPRDQDPADGLLIYFLGSPEEARALRIDQGSKPVIIATTTEHVSITEAIMELAAVLGALERRDVQADRVARRELQDRSADARRRMLDRVTLHLHPAAAGVEFRRPATDEILGSDRGLSSLLSAVCEDVYDCSPEISNEMLGRRELTSQAAKARRELLTAMIEKPSEDWLGMTGFGPEKAMYAALLRHTGIHRATPEEGFGYHPPRKGSMQKVWGAMSTMLGDATSSQLTLDKIYAKLMAPPYGLKEGAIPVLLTALLLRRREDIALYQEGTYQASITPDLLERLVKSPERFAVKHFKATSARAKILDSVVQAVKAATDRSPVAPRQSVGARNNTLLGATGPLLATVRSLPHYTLQTSSISEGARGVRDAVLNAREPDVLIFRSLPTACGLDNLGDKRQIADADLETFQQALSASLIELSGTYGALLEHCRRLFATEFGVSNESLQSVRCGLKHDAERLAATLLEPRLRSFVLLAINDDLDDEAWFEALVNNVALRPAAGWRDEDQERFELEVQLISGAFRRYQSLLFATLAQDDRRGFEPHKVTITSPDGSEYNDVIWINETEKPKLQKAMNDAIEIAQALLGSRGGEALMALLAGTVLASKQDDAEQLPYAAIKGKARRA